MTWLLIAVLSAAPPASTPEEAPDHWYGWQTLLADAGAVGFLVTAELAIHGANGGDQSQCGACGVLFVASAATFLFGAPVVHLAHGHGWKSLGDFGLRIGLPAATALLFAGLASGQGGLAAAGGGVVGAALGVVAASVVDAHYLAREPLQLTVDGSLDGRHRPVLALRARF